MLLFTILIIWIGVMLIEMDTVCVLSPRILKIKIYVVSHNKYFRFLFSLNKTLGGHYWPSWSSWLGYRCLKWPQIMYFFLKYFKMVAYVWIKIKNTKTPLYMKKALGGHSWPSYSSWLGSSWLKWFEVIFFWLNGS